MRINLHSLFSIIVYFALISLIITERMQATNKLKLQVTVPFVYYDSYQFTVILLTTNYAGLPKSQV